MSRTASTEELIAALRTLIRRRRVVRQDLDWYLNRGEIGGDAVNALRCKWNNVTALIYAVEDKLAPLISLDAIWQIKLNVD